MNFEMDVILGAAPVHDVGSGAANMRGGAEDASNTSTHAMISRLDVQKLAQELNSLAVALASAPVSEVPVGHGDANQGLRIAEIELAATITGGGKLALIGWGASVEGSATIKIKLKRM